MFHFRQQMHEGCGQQDTTTERKQGHHDPVSGLQVPSIFSRQPVELPRQQQREQTTDHGGTEEDRHGHPLGQHDPLSVVFTDSMTYRHMHMFRRHFVTNVGPNCGHQSCFYLKNSRVSGLVQGSLPFYSVVRCGISDMRVRRRRALRLYYARRRPASSSFHFRADSRARRTALKPMRNVQVEFVARTHVN